MELAFLGGATTVTGSQFLLETGDTRAPRGERLPRLDLRDHGDERSRGTRPAGRGQAADRVREARGATRSAITIICLATRKPGFARPGPRWPPRSTSRSTPRRRERV